MSERTASWLASVGVTLVGVGCYLVHPALGLIMIGILMIACAIYSDIQ